MTRREYKTQKQREYRNKLRAKGQKVGGKHRVPIRQASTKCLDATRPVQARGETMFEAELRYAEAEVDALGNWRRSNLGDVQRYERGVEIQRVYLRRLEERGVKVISQHSELRP